MKFNSIFAMFVLSVAVCLVVTDSVSAQRGGGGWGRGMGGGNSMGLLNSEKVQQELELADDQVDELKEIQTESMKSMRDMFSEMQDVPREERREMMGTIREKMTEKMEEFSKRADEVLMPHQRDRLKQLSFRSSARNRGAGGAFANEDLMKELELTDKQKEELEEVREKEAEDLKKEYAKLVAKAEENILKVLSKDQRKKYRELVGEPFEFEAARGWGGGRNRDQGNQRDGGK